MNVHWENPDHKKSYTGHFLFIATPTNQNTKINVNDITLSYKGQTIHPKVCGKNLEYSLPNETFLPGRSGEIRVDVIFNQPGSYSWDIGILKK
jgi:hypothetical protein